MASFSRRPQRSGAKTVARWAALAALIAALSISITNSLVSAHAAWVAIHYPFGLDYGEGIVWQQMRDMLAGHAYGPLGVFPAIVYHYPPAYHLTVGLAAAATGIDQLAMGRIVSALSTACTAALVGWLATAIRPSGDRIANAAGGLLAATLFLTANPVLQWGPLMRVDMLTCLFSVGGLVLAYRAIGRPWLILASAACFILAVYSKQTSIAAPAAALAGLLAVRPRLACMLAALCLVMGVIPLIALEWMTAGGFLRHLLLYNINRFMPDQIWALMQALRQHIVYLALSITGTALVAGELRQHWKDRRNNPRVAGAVMAIAYLVLKTLMLAMMLKSGASYNYMIEWFCAVAILAGVVTTQAIATVVDGFRKIDGPGARSLLLSAAALICTALQAQALPPPSLKMSDARAKADRTWSIVRLIEATPKPVISDNMTLLIRAGRPVQWEPAIAAELGATGLYDQPAFVRLIEQGYFGLFITDGDRSSSTFNGRYNPPVADAIARHYPRTWKMDRLTVHAPADDRP